MIRRIANSRALRRSGLESRSRPATPIGAASQRAAPFGWRRRDVFKTRLELRTRTAVQAEDAGTRAERSYEHAQTREVGRKIAGYMTAPERERRTCDRPLGERARVPRTLRWIALCGALTAFCIAASPSFAAAAPPAISATWTSEVAATSARLRAEIAPEGLPTTYHFLYLTEAAYLANLGAGREAFAGATKAPAGADPATTGAPVVQVITGLAAETAYRFLVVAANSAAPPGGTLGPERTLTTQAFGGAPLLADGRGWEMVSPVDKNGGQIQGPGGVSGGGVFQAAAGGGSITYGSTASFGPEAAGAPRASQYLSSRGEAGWSTENITGPTLSGAYGTHPDGVPYQLFSSDLAYGLLLDGRRCGEAESCPQGYSLRAGADGALTPSPEAPGLHLEGADPDLRHVVLSTCAALTPGATEIAGVGGSCDPAETNLYEWSEGALSLTNAAADHHARLAARSAAISTDGDRVYFTAGEDGPIFLREAGRPLKSIANTSGGVGTFQTASADGSLAFYTIGGDLYRYDAITEASEPLAAEVQGVLGAAADGNRVYYAGAHGIFIWDRGVTTEVAAGADAALPSDYPPATGTARVGADGSHLAFLSQAQLGDYENRGDSEVYLYSAPAQSLSCVSCSPTGERPRGPSSIPGVVANGAGPGATRIYKPRVLSADATRLFFDSEDSLAVADTNSRPDVYEWEAGGSGSCARPAGCINLISSGKSAGGAEFLDASEDGSDAFFLTDGSLVGSDPGSVDVYDARVGGGLPEPAAPIACEGDACQSLPPEPEDPNPGTLVRGAANPPLHLPAANKRHKKHHKKRHHRRRHHARPHGKHRRPA
jgi:hypothetical protein